MNTYEIPRHTCMGLFGILEVFEGGSRRHRFAHAWQCKYPIHSTGFLAGISVTFMDMIIANHDKLLCHHEQ